MWMKTHLIVNITKKNRIDLKEFDAMMQIILAFISLEKEKLHFMSYFTAL